MIIIFALISVVFSLTTANAPAYADKAVLTDIQKISSELFGDISVKSSEYLYNFDGSPDFIYVEFEGSGYAVYSRQSFDILEYSLSGTLPYSTLGHEFTSNIPFCFIYSLKYLLEINYP